MDPTLPYCKILLEFRIYPQSLEIVFKNTTKCDAFGLAHSSSITGEDWGLLISIFFIKYIFNIQWQICFVQDYIRFTLSRGSHELGCNIKILMLHTSTFHVCIYINNILRDQFTDGGLQVGEESSLHSTQSNPAPNSSSTAPLVSAVHPWANIESSPVLDNYH